MVAYRVTIPPLDVDRWDAYRAEAATKWADLLSALGPEVPVLDRLAWRSGLPETVPACPVLVGLVAEARRARFTWREIAVALGEGDGPEVEKQVGARFGRRIRDLEDSQGSGL
jgi:hypothetical protein